MINIRHEPGTNILLTTAIGKLEQADYDRMLPEAKKIIDQYGKVRWYFEMADFDGWTLGTAWRDLKFDVKHLDDFEKIAIVGQKSWMDFAAKVMEPFVSADVKHFTLEDQAEAHEWIKQ